MQQLSSVEMDQANGYQKPLFERSVRENGMVPNMFKNMANLPALLESYMNGYEKFRKESTFTPVEQEVVFLTISKVNECAYCIAGHAVVADVYIKVQEGITQAIKTNTALPNSKLNALSVFTALMVETRGNPSEQDVKTFLQAGYSETHILNIILAISVKTISNFSNHLFDTTLEPGF